MPRKKYKKPTIKESFLTRELRTMTGFPQEFRVKIRSVLDSSKVLNLPRVYFNYLKLVSNGYILNPSELDFFCDMFRDLEIEMFKHSDLAVIPQIISIRKALENRFKKVRANVPIDLWSTSAFFDTTRTMNEADEDEIDAYKFALHSGKSESGIVGKSSRATIIDRVDFS